MPRQRIKIETLPTASFFAFPPFYYALGAATLLFLTSQATLPLALLSAALFFWLTGLRLWSRAGVQATRVTALLPVSRFFPGERGEISVTCVNTSVWPLYLTLEQALPPGLASGSDSPLLQQGFYLGPRGRHTLSLSFVACRRGYFALPPLRLRSEDGLGFFACRREEQWTECITVYPRVVDLPSLPGTRHELLGPQEVAAALPPDPLAFAGLRPYQPELPARSIDWKASARRPEILARIVHPTLNEQLLLLLAGHGWAQSEGNTAFEAALALAASLLVQARAAKKPCGLWLDTAQVGGAAPFILPPSGRKEQLVQALEALAKAVPRPGPRLEPARLDFLGRRITTVIVIARCWDESLPRQLAALTTNRRRILCYLAADPPLSCPAPVQFERFPAEVLTGDPLS